MKVCSACGEEADEDHFNLIDVGKGTRKKCPIKNKFAQLIDTGEKEEEEKEKKRERKERKDERVYTEPPVYKPMDTRDIMLEVLQSPVHNLNKNQVAELLDIADDYDGVLTPAMLERLISNFEKIGPSKAKFIAERYSIKLEKARDRLSIADAERLGMDLVSKSERDRTGGDVDLEAKIARGISDGLRGMEHRFNVNNDIFAKPIEKILSNAAEATGLTSKIINIFFTGIEEQVRRDPYLIGDARDFIPQLPKLISGDQGERKGGEEGEKREEPTERSEERRVKSFEEEKSKNRRKTGGIFGELDDYFEVGKEEEEERD